MSLKSRTAQVIQSGNLEEMKKFRHEHDRKAKAAEVCATVSCAAAFGTTVAAPVTGGMSLIGTAGAVPAAAKSLQQMRKHRNAAHEVDQHIQKKVQEIESQKRKPTSR